MQLHELIHSMTKAEKRHFKLYAQMGSKSKNTPKYFALFNFLNTQSEQNEEILKGKGFSAETKNFLYEKILESLHVFHLHKSPDSELRLLLNQIAILFEKKLWNEMRKRLKKARQLAEGNERFLILLEIIEWEQELVSKSMDNTPIAQQRSLIDEKQTIQKKYIKENEYEDLATEVYTIRRQEGGWMSTTKGKQQFEQLIDTPLLNKDATLPSQKAKIQYHQINYISFIYRNQIDKAKEELKATIDTVKTSNFLFYMRDFAAFYVKTLFRYKQLSNTKDEKQSIHEIINNLSFNSLDITYTLHLQSIIEHTKQLNEMEGKTLISQMEQESNKYAKVIISSKIHCAFCCLVFFSIFNDWDNAQKWLDKIFKLGHSSERRDIRIFARLWQLVIAYETTSKELEKHVENSYKYLNRHNCYFETERQIIQAFKGLYKAIDYNERKIIWQNLYDFLDVKIKDKNMVTQRGIPELRLWCKSKIKRTTMAEVMRQHPS